MASNPIQWFPGHMAKTRRLMQECLPSVDLIFELTDARIPYSSRNPEIKKLLGAKPVITVMTKANLADPALSERWLDYYKKNGGSAVLIDSVTGGGIDRLSAEVRRVMSAKLERYHEKGMDGVHIDRR